MEPLQCLIGTDGNAMDIAKKQEKKNVGIRRKVNALRTGQTKVA